MSPTDDRQMMTLAKPHRFGHAVAFLREFVRRPNAVGALAPSSRQLAEEIVAQAGVASSNVILEFGAGTGSFTEVILLSKPSEASFVAIERNRRLCAILRHRFPRASVVTDSVENAQDILLRHGKERACCIVSGLPWSTFDDNLQDRLLSATLEVLKPGGRFVTFAYVHSLVVPGARKFRRKIRQSFSDVQISRVIWQNLPPAFVYQCTK